MAGHMRSSCAWLTRLAHARIWRCCSHPWVLGSMCGGDIMPHTIPAAKVRFSQFSGLGFMRDFGIS